MPCLKEALNLSNRQMGLIDKKWTTWRELFSN